MTIEAVMKEIFAQYPGCKQDTLQAIGKFLSRFPEDEIGKLWKRVDDAYDGTFAPDVGTFRKYAKLMGLASDANASDGVYTDWVWVCRCCGSHQPKATSGARCGNCQQAKGFTFLVTKENAAVINRRLFGRPQGPESWPDEPPHLFSLDYKAWAQRHPDAVAKNMAQNA